MFIEGSLLWATLIACVWFRDPRGDGGWPTHPAFDHSLRQTHNPAFDHLRGWTDFLPVTLRFVHLSLWQKNIS